MAYNDIYDLITTEETAFAQAVPVSRNYSWSMLDHIQTTVNYKNSIYNTGKSDQKPFKNITRPLLNLQYRAEGFDVKDIVLFVDDHEAYFKSFLVKKFHEKWARENDIDTFIDEVVESYVDFGGVLVKNVGEKRPQVVPLQRLAFCDQTDILGGPICEKHNYSPEALEQEGKGKWQNIDQVIALAEPERSVQGRQQDAKTPGKYIEVYEVHGLFPRYWLYDVDSEGKYYGSYYDATDPKSPQNDLVRQVHICSFYTTKEGKKNGITLYKGIEKVSIYKVLLRDKIYGRALGLGGAEELFEPQVWTNYDEIHKKNMLDAASKIIFQTTDPAFATRNKILDMENLEIAVLLPNTRIEQVETTPVNLQLFEKSTAEWFEHARFMAGAPEAITGENPSSGTPFKLQELITEEAHSLHEYRKGKIATFMDELYRDWIMPHISREIANGAVFLAELDLDELQAVTDAIVTFEANKLVKAKILNGETIDPVQVDAYKQQVRDIFTKGGNKKFIEILKGELADAPIEVELNIAGKQKSLSQMVDKLTNIFRTIVANPAILQSPAMAKLFNQILESSGLQPIDFSGFTAPTLAEAASAPNISLNAIPGTAPVAANPPAPPA